MQKKKRTGKRNPSRATSTRRTRNIWRRVITILRWAGWIVLLTYVLWQLFGGTVLGLMAAVCAEPKNATHAALEVFSWVRIAAEGTVSALRGR